MIRTGTTLIVACCLTTAGYAGMDLAITHGGGNAPSGSRDEMMTDQDDAILLEINNEIAGRSPSVTDPVSPLSTFTPADAQSTGEILVSASAPESGSTDSKAIYDRLSVRAVLRLLLYDDGHMAVPAPRQLDDPKHDEPPVYGPGAFHGEGSGKKSAAAPLSMEVTAPPPPTVPEPTTALLLGAAGGLTYLRRRRRRSA